jgi:hypothetical protein
VCEEQLNGWYETYHVAQRKIVWSNKIVVTTIKFAESCLQELRKHGFSEIPNCAQSPNTKRNYKSEK